jgi:hypothetical protein
MSRRDIKDSFVRRIRSLIEAKPIIADSGLGRARAVAARADTGIPDAVVSMVKRSVPATRTFGVIIQAGASTGGWSAPRGPPGRAAVYPSRREIWSAARRNGASYLRAMASVEAPQMLM